MSALTQISYVYAVGRSGTPLDDVAPSLSGLDGGRPHTVCAAGLCALVSPVPEDAFGSEGLAAQLEDLERLEVIARTHDAVIRTASRSTVVLPMRLATVYLDDERVATMLEERAAEFGALLSWLDGHAELGVKVYADPRAVAAARTEPTDEAVPAGGPGQAYLRRRRAQRRSRQDAYRSAGDVASRITDRATALARSRVSHRPQRGELSSGSGENIANDAYLVPEGRVAEFRAAVAEAGREAPGVRVEVTGPWAPYSFATTPPSSDGSGG